MRIIVSRHKMMPLYKLTLRVSDLTADVAFMLPRVTCVTLEKYIMAASSQTTFSNAFSSMKNVVFPFKFH